MTREEIEFSISQYADGTLPQSQRDALDERLAADSDVRAMLETENRLTALLRSEPLPAVRWDALSNRISQAVAQAEEPAQSYRLRWLTPAGLAIAASVMIAATVGIFLMQREQQKQITPPPAVARISIEVFNQDAIASTTLVQVEIGPSRAIADQPVLSHYADDVVTRPSRVIIASGLESKQDERNPY